MFMFLRLALSVSYLFMGIAGFIGLVWRMKLTDVAISAAILSAMLTAVALTMGSLWGRPTWGTWWEWMAGRSQL